MTKLLTKKNTIVVTWAKHFFLFVFIVVFMSGCGAVTPIPSPTTYLNLTLTPTPMPTMQSALTTESPENIESIYDIALSRDKKQIAVYTTKGIYLYDSFTLAKYHFIPLKQTQLHHQGGYRFSPSITFTPDGNQLIFSDKDIIESWDLINSHENENLYLSTSLIPDWNIFKIDYSPQGDRIIVSTYGYFAKCDETGVNFALYDLQFNLLFDHYFCTHNLESYYRFTSDNKVYIFSNARSMFFPLDFYNVDLATGNVLGQANYDLYSGHAENFVYDVSPNGQIFAIGNYKNYELSTNLVDAKTGKTLQTTANGVDLLLDGVGKLRKSKSDMVVNKKCNLTNKFEADQYQEIVSDDTRAVYTVSEWHPFPDSAYIRSLQLWDLSNCKIEEEITFP